MFMAMLLATQPPDSLSIEISSMMRMHDEWESCLTEYVTKMARRDQKRAPHMLFTDGILHCFDHEMPFRKQSAKTMHLLGFRETDGHTMVDEQEKRYRQILLPLIRSIRSQAK
jgi:hypothetical protein